MAHDRQTNPPIDRTVVASDDNDRDATLRKSQLLHLKDTDDFEIADGEPDVRGWDVRASDGRKLGEVEDLLVDTDAMRVRYVEVHLDKDVVDGDDAARYALVPVGAARLDEEDDNVLVDLSATNIPGLPAYKRGSVDRSYESSLIDRYRGNQDDADQSRQKSGRSETDSFYGGLQFDDDRFWGRRRQGREKTPYIRTRSRS